MKIKTFFRVLLLFCVLLLSSNCKGPKLGTTPATVEEAEKLRAKEERAQNKAAKKAKKKAYKRFWKMQSKEAKKSVKRNARRQRKIARSKS